MAESPNRTLPAALPTSATALVTAGGAGTWTVVRTIQVANTDTVIRYVTFGIHTAATDAASRRIISAEPVLQNSSFVYDGYLVLMGHASTPDILYGLGDAASVLACSVHYVTGP